MTSAAQFDPDGLMTMYEGLTVTSIKNVPAECSQLLASIALASDFDPDVRERFVQKALQLSISEFVEHRIKAFLLLSAWIRTDPRASRAIDEIEIPKWAASGPSEALDFGERGQMFERLQMFEHALSDYDESVRLGLDHPSIYFLRGWVNLQVGHAADALSDFQEYMQMAPDNADGYFAAGVACKSLQQYPEARTYLSRAVELGDQSALEEIKTLPQ
jgi:tetratricopeptide (TPR) repeat protein